MAELMEYLERVVGSGDGESKASDLFIVAGAPVSMKVDRRMEPVIQGEERLRADGAERLIRELYESYAHRPMSHLLERKDDDFSFAVPKRGDGFRGARFRVNAYLQRGSMAAVIRVVPFEIPSYQKLGIPENVMDLAEVTRGLVLITGTAGSGKSTTQACIIDRINHNREAHIITLEDPIEYLHKNDKSIVSQREIAIDTEDYLSALRACLRQAPDVILLGEMRDHETISTALTAAETGHLVIATLHTGGAASTIDRIVESYPGEQQSQVRAQLSLVLHSVVSQQLLPEAGVDGGLIPACEIMHRNDALRAVIRDKDKSNQIDTYIKEGRDEGMITMDDSVEKLLREGRITEETAKDASESLRARMEQQEQRLEQRGQRPVEQRTSREPERRGLWGRH